MQQIDLVRTPFRLLRIVTIDEKIIMTANTDNDTSDDHQHPKQPHLAKQDASLVDPSKLTALTPEVVSIP